MTTPAIAVRQERLRALRRQVRWHRRLVMALPLAALALVAAYALRGP